LLCYGALVELPARYPALVRYSSLSAVALSLACDPDALDALALAYRTEPHALSEGAYHLLIVALGAALVRLAPRAQDGGEILEALLRAAREPGVPLLLAISRDLRNARQADQRRAAREAAVHDGLSAYTPSPASDPLLRRRLAAALAALSPGEQELAGYLLRGFTPLEISQETGRGRGAVREAILRLRRKLKTQGVTV
jgi:DNA-binding CsgD family transcriptional regulator